MTIPFDYSRFAKLSLRVLQSYYDSFGLTGVLSFAFKLDQSEQSSVSVVERLTGMRTSCSKHLQKILLISSREICWSLTLFWVLNTLCRVVNRGSNENTEPCVSSIPSVSTVSLVRWSDFLQIRSYFTHGRDAFRFSKADVPLAMSLRAKQMNNSNVKCRI